MPDVMFVEGYGLTETSPAASMSPFAHNVPNSCGQPLPNTRMKVVDMETGRALGVREKGEVCITGPQIMRGYLGNEEATRNCIHDGWFHTGDLGYYDEEGNFYIADRLKELIKVKGLQVRREVEICVWY